MDSVLFTASIWNFRPLWFLAPTFVYFLLALVSLIPQSRLTFARIKRKAKIFLLIQCVILEGHIYAFATELVPYYMQKCEIVEGNVENFVPPTNRYNRREAFSVDGIDFEYGYNDISFGYHNTVLDSGIINQSTENIRLFYVHNELNSNNIIVRIESTAKTE